MTASVAVATDSSSCVAADAALTRGLLVAPLGVALGDAPYVPESECGPEDILAAHAAGLRVRTSQPSPGDLARVLAAARERGVTDVVVVALSGELSGTANAWAAVPVVDGPTVTVVDSRTVSGALGFAAVAAADAALAGADAAEVAAVAARVARTSFCGFTVDSLTYLQRGGRVGAVKALVGDALGMRPLLEVRDGRIEAVGTVRSSIKARAALVERALGAAAAMQNPTFAVMTLPGDEQAAQAAASALEAQGGPVVFCHLAAALAAHTGPGALAIAVADVPPGAVPAS